MVNKKHLLALQNDIILHHSKNKEIIQSLLKNLIQDTLSIDAILFLINDCKYWDILNMIKNIPIDKKDIMYLINNINDEKKKEHFINIAKQRKIIFKEEKKIYKNENIISF